AGPDFSVAKVSGTTYLDGTPVPDEWLGTGMGFLDRDYYRDDEGSPLAAWLRQGLVSKILLAVYILVYIIQISTQNGSIPFPETLCLRGDRVLHGEVWRVLTYGFLHPIDSLLPLLFNIPLLYVVSREVEERLGHRRFLLFYLGAILAGGLAMLGA